MRINTDIKRFFIVFTLVLRRQTHPLFRRRCIKFALGSDFNQVKILLRRPKQISTVAIEAAMVFVAHNNSNNCLFLSVFGNSIACRKQQATTGFMGGACLDTNDSVGAKQLVCVFYDACDWYLCLRSKYVFPRTRGGAGAR